MIGMWSRTVHYCFILHCAVVLFLLFAIEAQPVENGVADRINDGTISLEELIPDTSKDVSRETLTRNKRTIGFLRQLFPGLSQIIDRKIQQITRVIFRIVGRLILRGGAGGGATAGGTTSDGSGAGGDKGRRISITLPTYPPFEDDEEEEGSTTLTAVSDTAPGDAASGDASSSDKPTTTTSEQPTPASDINTNQVSDSQDNSGARINRDVSDVLADSPSSISVSDEESSTLEPEKKQTGGLFSRLRDMRSKRMSFRFGAGGGNNGNGGSGNFLFDIVRLVSGSGISPEKDEELNAPREEREDGTENGTNNNSSDSTVSDTSDDVYGAAIPGPLTRILVIANRGISNMIQDLILRLAQTSERIINFKARLITSVI